MNYKFDSTDTLALFKIEWDKMKKWDCLLMDTALLGLNPESMALKIKDKAMHDHNITIDFVVFEDKTKFYVTNITQAVKGTRAIIRIATEILEYIKDGTYGEGEYMSNYYLKLKFKSTSYTTYKKAISLLIQNGCIKLHTVAKGKGRPAHEYEYLKEIPAGAYPVKYSKDGKREIKPYTGTKKRKPRLPAMIAKRDAERMAAQPQEQDDWETSVLYDD